MKARYCILLCGCVVLQSCTSVGPVYDVPNASLSNKFVEGSSQSIADVALSSWWQDLNDRQLNQLVERGLSQNIDIQTALERVVAARAVLGTTGGAALTSGGFDGSIIRQGGDETSTDTVKTATGTASFILDIFGRQRRAREQAKAQLQASQFDVGTARLSFFTSLVGYYIDARYNQEALELTRQTISSLQKTLGIVQAQRAVGAAGRLEVANAEALLEEEQTDLPALETSFFAAVYGIAALLDEPAEPLYLSLQKGAPQPLPKRNSGDGIPADLLRNRPDINSAERDLAAATAAIGMAEADLYPSITLDGSISVASTSTWSFGPTLVLPVLNQRALRATRDQRISLARQAELSWRDAVNTAVQEVQTAQTKYLRARRTVEAGRRAAEAYDRVLEISRETYEAGVTDLSDLLDAERNSASSRLTLATATQTLTTAWLTLQIASGKGWARE